MPRPSIDEAAQSLNRHLRGRAWFRMVGIGLDDFGDPAIYLYVASTNTPELSNMTKVWETYPVVVKRSGAPRPVAP